MLCFSPLPTKANISVVYIRLIFGKLMFVYVKSSYIT